jgi:hypothetical protein
MPNQKIRDAVISGINEDLTAEDLYYLFNIIHCMKWSHGFKQAIKDAVNPIIDKYEDDVDKENDLSSISSA